MSNILDEILGGGGAPAAAQGDPTADPFTGTAPDAAPQGGGEDEPIQLIQSMIDSAKKYIEVEPDEEDKATMTDLLNRLQKYLAKDQQERDGMMQGKVTPRAMRKAAGGGLA